MLSRDAATLASMVLLNPSIYSKERNNSFMIHNSNVSHIDPNLSLTEKLKYLIYLKNLFKGCFNLIS